MTRLRIEDLPMTEELEESRMKKLTGGFYFSRVVATPITIPGPVAATPIHLPKPPSALPDPMPRFSWYCGSPMEIP